MWKKLKIDGSEFFIKHHVIGIMHKVCLTNFIHLWIEDILEENLLLRCKDLNKLIEASDEVFLGNIWSLVEGESCDNNEIVRDLASSDAGKTLTLQTSLEGFKFRIKFLLAQASHCQFYEEVTKPLLTMVCELDKRQQQLVDVIKTKDMEIEEYKLEGGQISRKAVQTEPFDLDAFSEKCQESISTSKSLVAACPSHVFTPYVQDMLDKIATAPQLILKENQEESKPTKSKKLVVTLKSPPKNKKQKIYDDDVDHDDSRNKVTKENDKKEELEVKQEPRQLEIKEETRQLHVKQESRQLSPVKAKQNSRIQRALNNL